MVSSTSQECAYLSSWEDQEKALRRKRMSASSTKKIVVPKMLSMLDKGTWSQSARNIRAELDNIRSQPGFREEEMDSSKEQLQSEPKQALICKTLNEPKKVVEKKIQVVRKEDVPVKKMPDILVEQDTTESTFDAEEEESDDESVESILSEEEGDDESVAVIVENTTPKEEEVVVVNNNEPQPVYTCEETEERVLVNWGKQETFFRRRQAALRKEQVKIPGQTMSLKERMRQFEANNWNFKKRTVATRVSSRPIEETKDYLFITYL